MTFRRALGCLAILLGSLPARGELVYFARGGEAQLPARVQGSTVRVETPDGPKTFPRKDFLAIVLGHDPAEEWSAIRAAATLDGSNAARFSAAWWALEHGLTPEAVALLSEPPESPAPNEPNGRCVATLRSLAPSCPDPDLDALRQRLRPSRFREIRSDHVVLLHQAGESEARERLDVLERVVGTFYLTLTAHGIDLAPPRERLVSVWFSDQADYASFLRRSEAEPFLGTQGYYHPTLRVVFAFDARDTEAQRSGRRAIAHRRKGGTPDSDLDRQSLLLDLEWRALDFGIAAHETVHQLIVVSGLAPRIDDFPTWLHEGLAAQFESIRGGRWAGVGRVHDLRLADWRTIRPAPALAPLLRDSGLGHGYRRDRYAEAWALVYFLRKTKPTEFRTFLDLLRAPSPDGPARPDRSLIAFRSAFGDDLPAIEKDWRRYIDDLRTPLESARPARSSSEAPGR